MALAEEHPSVGDIHGVGLLQVVELVTNRETREPLSPFNAPLSEPMQRVANELRDSGMSTFVRWNMIFCTPPLIIDDEQINEGSAILDRSLAIADRFTTE